jgi:hypothetical protein
MRAVLLYGQGDVRVESVPDPTLQGPSDVIVELWILHGARFSQPAGLCILGWGRPRE